MKRYSSIAIIIAAYFTPTECRHPKLTIAIIVDQLAYTVLEKLRPCLQGGLRFLLDEGLVYTNARTSYAWPSTAPGHTSLSTGTPPKDHGIIGNNWYDEFARKKIVCDDDTVEQAAVFGPTGMLNYGKSPHNIMVNTLSDQLIIQKQRHKEYHVFSISGKSRSAIATAGRGGKAFWFDTQTGMFTSSKAYVETLPTWVQQFNKTIARRTPYTWNLQYPCLPVAYDFKGLFNCLVCQQNKPMIGGTFTPTANDNKDPYSQLMKTPFGSKIVLDCALACLDANLNKKPCDEKIFMWIMIGCLDKLGHDYGPHSNEVIDMVYHIDRQLKEFIDAVYKRTNKRNVLWALSSDHGVAPCPEQLNKEGFAQAHRILEQDLIKKLNTELAQLFQIERLVLDAEDGAIALDRTRYANLEKKQQRAIRDHIIKSLEAIPGIKKVWTNDQLYNLSVAPESIEQMFKNQLYPGRNSSFLIQTTPYTFITDHPDGTTHHTPYDYDTHIPLVIYQRGHYQRKKIYDRVTNTQLAPTLAHILEVPRPSASVTQLLPAIIHIDDPCF